MIVQFFTDPILRAPTIGSMLMCLVTGLVGVLVFIRKRSLLGEALSHAAYPGVTAAVLLAGLFSLEASLPFLILAGAFCSSLLGYWLIDRMEKKLKVSPDAALTAILAFFFGIGVTIASFVQNSYASLFRQIQAYLYGQAATMTDIHVVIYGGLALVVIVFVATCYKEILALSFDASFTKAHGLVKPLLEPLLFIMVVLALVIGVRCVGVILMSAMLIAPATAARQFTNSLLWMLILAALFGALSGFLGIYFSVVKTHHYSLPTGPLIVLFSGGFALLALLFAPKRGLVIRYIRIVKFRAVCIQENLLKALWRLTQEGKKTLEFQEISQRVGLSSLYAHLLLYRLKRQRALEKVERHYKLTSQGLKRGARIVRLHRLWEVYLVHSLGLKIERVHKSAEEMEHILTPELEEKLLELLDHPKQDPHDQPIPEG